MCGGGCLWLLVCLGRWWSGPAGGAASAERWAAGRVSWVGSRGCGWLVRVGIGDTLSAACVWWWWVPPCVLGACGGGMLSGFWGSAPWVARPVQGSISWGFGWVWVGWL